MRAISYAVRTATHTLFVPAAGPVLGESDLALALCKVGARARFIAALLLAFVSMVIPVLLWIVVLGCGALTGLWIAAQRQSISFPRMLGFTAAAALLLFLAFVYSVSEKSVS